MGHTTAALCRMSGASYRQADYWDRLDVLTPSIRQAQGTGSRRRYSHTDVRIASLLVNLSRLGASTDTMRRLTAEIRGDPTALDWPSVYVSADGIIGPTPVESGWVIHAHPDRTLAGVG